MPTWHTLLGQDPLGRPRQTDQQSLLADLITDHLSAPEVTAAPAVEPELPPVAPPPEVAGPSRADQASRLAQDIAYGRSDWERAGQALIGADRFEEASGLRRAGAVLGGVGLGTLALASWIPGFNVFKPAQAARSARAFGQGAAQGARAGTGIVRGGLDEAAALERSRRGVVAGQAADVSEAFGREVASGSVNYTARPDLIESTRFRKNAIEIIHRQGFDRIPESVDPAQFARLAADTDNYIPIYRGLSPRGASAEDYRRAFHSGDFFVGQGSSGSGAYFATTPEGAASYLNLNPGQPGAMIEAVVPRSARIFTSDASENAAAMMQQFWDSPFTDLAEFLVAKGYDGLMLDNAFVLYNRGAAIVPRL